MGEMTAERGLSVSGSCIWRWVQIYGPELDKRCRRHLKPTNRSWRLDETYIKVKGQERFLYRAVDSAGQTIDFLLTSRRREIRGSTLITPLPGHRGEANGCHQKTRGQGTVVIPKSACPPMVLARERSDHGFSSEFRGGHARRERLPQAGLRGSYRRWFARHSLNVRTRGATARHVTTAGTGASPSQRRKSCRRLLLGTAAISVRRIAEARNRPCQIY